ncbi:MAG TPA: hypothetical protein VGR15_03975, partial [Bacteroidota bacterium]|nr:hypothetical protein [Bacteroidota bacterium]
ILVGDISATRIDSNMEFKVSMQRQGNAAYLGNINLLLHDQNGRVVAEFKREIAVYRSLLRRYELNVSNLPKGNYTVELRLTTDREGNSPGEILQVNPVYRSLSVQLQ